MFRINVTAFTITCPPLGWKWDRSEAAAKREPAGTTNDRASVQLPLLTELFYLFSPSALKAAAATVAYKHAQLKLYR